MVQIFASCHGIAHVELHSLPGTERIAYSNGATRGISSHERANEEVAAIKLVFVLVDDPSHQEGCACQGLIFRESPPIVSRSTSRAGRPPSS